MPPSDDEHIDDGRNKEKAFRFSLRKLLVVMTILAAVLAVVGYGIRKANRPSFSAVLQKELENLFKKGTPRKDVEQWVASQKVPSTGFSIFGSLFFALIDKRGNQTPFDMAKLRRAEVGYVLRAEFAEDSVATDAYFFFDHYGQLIKFYIDEFSYSP